MPGRCSSTVYQRRCRDARRGWPRSGIAPGRCLQRFTGLTHLFLYNDIDATADLAVLLETQFAHLTHLSLGHGPKDAAVLELLATTRSLPSLQEFCFGGGPVRTDPAWDRVLAASFPVYLHGQRVTGATAKHPCPNEVPGDEGETSTRLRTDRDSTNFPICHRVSIASGRHAPRLPTSNR